MINKVRSIIRDILTEELQGLSKDVFAAADKGFDKEQKEDKDTVEKMTKALSDQQKQLDVKIKAKQQLVGKPQTGNKDVDNKQQVVIRTELDNLKGDQKTNLTQQELIKKSQENDAQKQKIIDDLEAKLQQTAFGGQSTQTTSIAPATPDVSMAP